MSTPLIPLHAGFRLLEASDVAGGPIELEFSLEVPGPAPCFLLVAGERQTGRPGGFSFVTTFADEVLADPCAGVPDLGGPAGVVEIAPGRPWRQPILLNEFVRLETVWNRLRPGESDRLTVVCRRALSLGLDRSSALHSSTELPSVETLLEFELRRDEARLIALVDQLMAEVISGKPEQRERPLRSLLSLRVPLAVDRWRQLVNHPDPLVAQRVAQASEPARGLREAG